MSESAPRPRRSFHSEVFAEQYRVQGGAEADPQAILKLDLKDVAKVYERNGLREIYLSERIREAQLQLEARLSGDDYRLLDKQRHVQILALFLRIQTVAGFRELSSSEKSYADLGRAVVELLGTPLSHAASGYMHYKTGLGKEREEWRNKVPGLQADISLALHHLGQMTNGELRHSVEAIRRGTAIAYIEDCLARELRLPDEREIRERTRLLRQRRAKHRAAMEPPFSVMLGPFPSALNSSGIKHSSGWDKKKSISCPTTAGVVRFG